VLFDSESDEESSYTVLEYVCSTDVMSEGVGVNGEEGRSGVVVVVLILLHAVA